MYSVYDTCRIDVVDTTISLAIDCLPVRLSDRPSAYVSSYSAVSQVDAVGASAVCRLRVAFIPT